VKSGNYDSILQQLIQSVLLFVKLIIRILPRHYLIWLIHPLQHNQPFRSKQ
jgi:hypothetical protein